MSANNGGLTGPRVVILEPLGKMKLYWNLHHLLPNAEPEDFRYAACPTEQMFSYF